MNYNQYSPNEDLSAFIKCYWTLEFDAPEDAPEQRVVPDGCVELYFILGDVPEGESSLQARGLVLGQITEPFYFKPEGNINTFAVRFYPLGFSYFTKKSLKTLSNIETPIHEVFEQQNCDQLIQDMLSAEDTQKRIQIIESFLLGILNLSSTINDIVEKTLDHIVQHKGNSDVATIINNNQSTRRTLERNFQKHIGLSAKQLGKIVRMQSALEMMQNSEDQQFTRIAYDAQYYDQAHFNRDFKELTGINPKEFLGHEQMQFSSTLFQASSKE